MHYLGAEAGGWPSIRMTQKEKQEPHEQGGTGKGKIDSGMNLEREVGGEVKLDPRSGSHPLVPTEIAITEVDDCLHWHLLLINLRWSHSRSCWTEFSVGAAPCGSVVWHGVVDVFPECWIRLTKCVIRIRTFSFQQHSGINCSYHRPPGLYKESGTCALVCGALFPNPTTAYLMLLTAPLLCTLFLALASHARPEIGRNQIQTHFHSEFLQFKADISDTWPSTNFVCATPPSKLHQTTSKQLHYNHV